MLYLALPEEFYVDLFTKDSSKITDTHILAAVTNIQKLLPIQV